MHRLTRPPIAAVFTVLVLPAATGLAHILGRSPFGESHPDAEKLTGAVLVRDLLNGGNLSDWVLPEASYIAPDWGLWLLIELVGLPSLMSVWVFGVLQLSVLFGLWSLIARHGRGGLAHPGIVVGPLLIVLLALSGSRPVSFALVSFWRFGTVILTLGALLATWAVIRSTDRRSMLAMGGVLSLIVFAAHISDEIVVVWFSAPVLAALFVMTRSFDLDTRRVAIAASGVAVGHIVGFAVEPSIGIPLETYQAGIDPTVFVTRSREFAGTYNFMFASAPVATALAASGLLLCALILRRRRATNLEAFLALHLLFATASTIGAQLILGGPSPLGPRMVTHIFVFATLYLGYGAAELVTSAFASSGASTIAKPVGVLFVMVAVAGFLTPQANRGIGFELQVASATCVRDALSGHTGASGVASWASQNTIAFYADNELRITNLADAGNTTVHTNWPHNTTWATPHPSFAIADGWDIDDGDGPAPILTRTPIIATFGEPEMIVECGRWDVLVYS